MTSRLNINAVATIFPRSTPRNRSLSNRQRNNDRPFRYHVVVRDIGVGLCILCDGNGGRFTSAAAFPESNRTKQGELGSSLSYRTYSRDVRFSAAVHFVLTQINPSAVSPICSTHI